MSEYKIISRIRERFHITFELQVKNRKLTVKFTSHAVERTILWQLKENEIINTLLFPDEVVTGHGNRFIAHKVKNSQIIRVIYEYRDKIPFVITVYAPSKERYFQGGNIYADKILA